MIDLLSLRMLSFSRAQISGLPGSLRMFKTDFSHLKKDLFS